MSPDVPCGPVVTAPALPLSELVGALSHALDITEGQPEGHCLRSCFIATAVGREISLPARERSELAYAVLLKDLGCSSNAARICALYLADDVSFKRDFKLTGDGVPAALRFVLSHTGLGQGLSGRFRAVLHIVRNGGAIAQELIETRCERGAGIARRMRFSPAVAEAIRSLDEHWDGGGKPDGLRGEAIPLYSRIALLAQVADVYRTGAGPDQAQAEVRRRAGTWLDPDLAGIFGTVSGRAGFWEAVGSPDLDHRLLAEEAGWDRHPLDDDYLDDVAAGFAEVVDAKSPYTGGHSSRVALFADVIAGEMNLSPRHRRWLKRTALLHDVGKLGVSNAILDKPGKLDDVEWGTMRAHAAHSERILSRIAAFGGLARTAGAHHERLDGRGYPRGLRGDEVGLDARIITTADVFDALTAERPYRAAMPLPQALAILRGDLGTAIDPRCFAALEAGLARTGLRDSTPETGQPAGPGQPAAAGQPLPVADRRAA